MSHKSVPSSLCFNPYSYNGKVQASAQNEKKQPNQKYNVLFIFIDGPEA